jgi:hypothetical protein
MAIRIHKANGTIITLPAPPARLPTPIAVGKAQFYLNETAQKLKDALDRMDEAYTRMGRRRWRRWGEGP